MALTCHFFTFSKKINSIAIPAQGTETSVTVELKSPTDIQSLQLMIGGSITNPTVYNYCFIPTFNRFYFIRNWGWDMGRWVADCKVDVLASYRATILSSTQYVLRSASQFDGSIKDDLYPLIARYDTESGTCPTSRGMTAYIENGVYVVGVIGITGSVGAVNYYILTPTQFGQLKSLMFNNVTWTGVTNPTMNNDLLKCFFSPFDYIVSCKWCPDPNLATKIHATAATAIGFGFWIFTVNCYSVDATTFTFYTNAWTVPAGYFSTHPQETRGVYMKMSPFSEYTAALQPYGIFKLPPECSLMGMYCVECIDAITGHAFLEIFVSDDSSFSTINPCITLETDMFVDIQLAQVRSEGGVAGALRDTAIGGFQSMIAPLTKFAFFDGANNIANIARAQYENLKVGTPNGSFAEFGRLADFDMRIFSRFYYAADDDITHFGRPLCKSKLLSLLSGYTMCSNADISINGTDEESLEINNYLNSGFYIE